MKRATFIDLLMTVEELNEKLKQLETFVGGPVDCLNHTMCSILDAISEDMGLNKFDDDIACIIFDYCFHYKLSYNILWLKMIVFRLNFE